MNNNQEKEDLKIWGEKIAHIIEADKAPQATVNAIENIIHDITNENCIPIYDPDIVRACFPMFIQCSPNDYGRAAFHCLQSIINALPDDQKAELKQFEKTESDFPTEEENTNRSRQLVAEWLVNSRKNSAPELNDLIEDLFEVFTTEYSTADTVEGIIDCLCQFDEQIRDDRDYKPAHDAAGIMISIVKILGYENKVAEHFDNIYIFWMNPEDGEIDYSEIRGIRLAEIFLNIMENPHTPTRISDAMRLAMGDVFNHDLTPDQQNNLPDSGDDQNAEYIDGLFRAYAENQMKESETTTDESQTITEAEKLACQISDIMKNPLLPEQLRNVIADEINDTSNADLFTPENVLYNLEILRGNGTPFIPAADNVPNISDVPHSKPANKRIYKPKIAKRPAKPTKPGKKGNSTK